MSNTNAIKSRLLGENYSTASSRLRKSVVFALIQRYGEDLCYRCGFPIESVQELSLEHAEPWQSAPDPRSSFMDLSNVTFSHLSCNRNAAIKVGNSTIGRNYLRLVGPEGTSWCGTCRTFKPSECFSKNKARWNGLQDQCRECRADSR